MKNQSYQYNRTPKSFKFFGVFLFLGLLTNTAFAQKKPVSKTPKKQKSVTRPLPRKDVGGEVRVHSVGVGVGQTFLAGDFQDNGEDRITADLYYNFKASHSFDFNVNFHTSSHDFRETEVSTTGLAFGIKGKAYQFDAFSPFALAGVGFYLPSVTRNVNGELLESDDKLVFGIHLGAGAELQLSRRVTVGLMGHYHNPFDVRQELGPDVEGAYFKMLLTSFYNF